MVSRRAEPAWQRRPAALRAAGELGGAEVPPDEAVASLERLGFAVRARDAASVTVAVPSWRNDVAAGVVLDQASDLDAGRRNGPRAVREAVEAEAI